MSLFNVSSLVQDVSGAVKAAYDSAVHTSCPVFKDAAERRTTQAVCSMAMGEALCVPKKTPSLNNFMLSLFKGAARDVMTSSDSKGKDVVSFNLADKSYSLLCGAGTCAISEYAEPQRSLTVADVLLGILSAPLACEGSDSSSGPRDAGQFEDINSGADNSEVDYSWVFCGNAATWSNPVNENDCFENEHIQDKLSTSLYLSGPYLSPDCSGDIFTADYDEFMLLLLREDKFSLKLRGNNLWPTGYFEKCFSMSRGFTPPYLDGAYWEVEDGPANIFLELVAFKENWTIRLALKQAPLCTVMYEAPCDEE